MRKKMRFITLFTGIFFFSLIDCCFGQLSSCPGIAGNPVVNITFGSGNNPGSDLPTIVPGATTTMIYIPVTGNPANPVPLDGDYTITNNVPDNGAWFVGAADHTPNNPNGYMAFYNANEQPSEFYSQTITGLTGSTTYQFAAWIANALNPAVLIGVDPNITFSVESLDGTIIGTYNTGDIPQNSAFTWVQYGFCFNTPENVTTIVLKMINNSPGGTQNPGNDFAVDDITFSPIIPGNNTTCEDWLKVNADYSGVTVGDLNITGNQVTIEAKFNRILPDQGPAEVYQGDIVSKHNNPTDANYLLRPDDAEITTSNGYFRTPDICDIDTGKTYYVAMVYDGDTLRFFRNGFLMSKVAASGNLVQNNWITTIGSLASGEATTYPEYLAGYINEVRVWNIARTQSELQTYMNTSLPNPTTQAGLLAYYQFNSLTNLQGNAAWNGTIKGNASINQANPSCAGFVADSCNIISVNPVNVIDSFTAPDTVCVNTIVNVQNMSVDATNYNWSFCAADFSSTPDAVNIGNPGGLLNQPVFSRFALDDNGNYYGLTVNYAVGELVRLNFGTSLLNNPTAEDLGGFNGVIPSQAEGIQLLRVNGNWSAIIVGGGNQLANSSPRIVNISFGNSLANIPTATNWGNVGGLNLPHDLFIGEENGNFYGFAVNANDNTLTQISFGPDFTNTPTGVNLGNIGNLDYPAGITFVKYEQNWYAFVANRFSNSLTRLAFGSSLLNVPTGTNIGNPGGVLSQPYDVSLFTVCEGIYGFVVNYGTNDLVKLDFGFNLLSNPTATDLGNIGNLDFPHSISQLFQVGNDIYTFIQNVSNNTLTRIRFSGCQNIPASNLQNPLPFSYTQPGIYNINLLVDLGLPTQTSYCKTIVVLASAQKHPLVDSFFCTDTAIVLKSNFTSTNYLWNNGSTDSSITATQSGIYWVEGGTAQCSVKDSFSIKLNALPVINLGNDTSICPNTKIGLNAGNSGSKYHWQDNSTNQTDTITKGGIYYVTITDSNKCVNSDTIKVAELSLPVLSLINDTSICTGNSVQLSANAQGNNSYSWSPSSTLSNGNISNPVATPADTTKYFVQVTGNNTCKALDSVMVNVLLKPQIKAPADTSTCIGNYITLRTQSSNANIFEWSPPTGLNDPSIADPVVDAAANITYTLTAGNGVCPSVQTTVNLYILPLPVVSISNDTTICGTAQAPLFATGGIQYLWAPATGLSNTNISDPIASPLIETTYYVTVTDANQCASKDSVLINVKPKPDFTVDPPSQSICIGDSTTFTASGGDIYQWYPDSYISDTASATPIVYPSSATNYSVYIYNDACKVGATLPVNVIIKPSPVVTIAKTNDVNCVIGETNLNATGGINYSWTPANFLSNPNIADPVATPSSTTMFYVDVTNSSACTSKDSIEVKVFKGDSASGYLVPSAFTPNGDGKNDCFGVKEWGNVTNFKLSVYNRWGNLIFQTANVDECWDGTYKGIIQPSGTYVYQIFAQTLCGTVYRKGTVVLIR
jgi:gliding motility-associated-like protein